MEKNIPKKNIERRLRFMLKIDKNENRHWYNEKDKLHREDGPACEYVNGSKYWFFNDKLHRVDGPAIEWSNGDKEWYVNGKLHRDDGPAIEWSSGYKSWYLNGVEHKG